MRRFGNISVLLHTRIPFCAHFGCFFAPENKGKLLEEQRPFHVFGCKDKKNIRKSYIIIINNE